MSLDDRTISLIKGMLARGDKQSDIGACFGENGGRVAEIHNSMTRSHVAGEVGLTTRAREIAQAAPEQLPPPPPYPTPYDLVTATRSLWEARVALEHTKEKIELALAAIVRIEAKLQP